MLLPPVNDRKITGFYHFRKQLLKSEAGLVNSGGQLNVAPLSGSIRGPPAKAGATLPDATMGIM
jgi:hypothetical protein